MWDRWTKDILKKQHKTNKKKTNPVQSHTKSHLAVVYLQIDPVFGCKSKRMI